MPRAVTQPNIEVMNIIKKLRQTRIDKKLTQEDVAKKMNVTKSYVCQLESNRTTPEISTLRRYASAMGEAITITYADATERYLHSIKGKKR